MIELPEITPTITIHKKSKKPTYGGIYALYSKEGILLYVGKTMCFRQRLHLHYYQKLKNFYHFIEFYKIDLEVDRDIYETYLINKWKPLFNDKKTWSYKSHYKKIDQIKDVKELPLDGVKIIDISTINTTEIMKKKRITPLVVTDDDFVNLATQCFKWTNININAYRKSMHKSDVRKCLNGQGYSITIADQDEYFEKLTKYGFRMSKMSIYYPIEYIVSKE
ncbi:hypothetical protein [Priestia megaterium]|uniref:hypothetical protein n=1 Tax=Priestia megaterium TaxID=1404 RepID=UPI00366CDD74